MMRLRDFGLALMLLLIYEARAEYSFDQMQSLQNDKEPLITVFSKKSQEKIAKKYTDSSVIKSLSMNFYAAVQDTLNNDPGVCDLGLINNYINLLNGADHQTDEKSLKEYLKVLRVNHYIDDVLYKISSSALKDYFKLKELNLSRKGKTSGASSKLLRYTDVEDLFSGFYSYPDEKNDCSYQSFFYIKNNIWISENKKSTRSKDLSSLISEALKENLIDLETYHKLNYLNDKADLDKRDLWLRDYLKIIFYAKNKMVPKNSTYTVRNIEDENSFSAQKIRRFSKITRRRLLYRKYDETQIILLSQVLQKASRRMGADPDTITQIPFITQEFTLTNPDGGLETFTEVFMLDSQSQYNLARRRLRKDILDLQVMDIFVKSNITHEDVVMAALETGYISLEDIEHVVKYDDLWNPSISRFERISGFIFNVAGYSSFFLPPPWNIIATIGLGVVEGIVDNQFVTGENNDNPATFIE